MFTCVLSCFSPVQLCVTLWTVTHQAPLSMEFFRQEYWSGLPCPPPGALPNPINRRYRTKSEWHIRNSPPVGYYLVFLLPSETSCLQQIIVLVLSMCQELLGPEDWRINKINLTSLLSWSLHPGGRERQQISKYKSGVIGAIKKKKMQESREIKSCPFYLF